MKGFLLYIVLVAGGVAWATYAALDVVKILIDTPTPIQERQP